MVDSTESLRLRVGCILDELSLPLREPAIQGLLDYLALLQRWNATYNLTAVREPDKMLTQHLADCLAIVQPLQRQFGTEPALQLLDVGSGGGLPGAIVALAIPTLTVTCVDTVGKKAAFIQQVAATLKLRNLSARHARVEEMTDASFDVVTSRAFASLPDFTRLTAERLCDDGTWLAMKGKLPQAEMTSLPSDVEVFHVEQLTVPGLDADRNLIWMRKVPSTRSL